MASKTETLSSGVVLTVQTAPFSIANKLRKVLLTELQRVRLDLDLSGLDPGKELSLDSLTPSELNSVKDLVCQLASSDAVEACVWECLKAGCLYGETKVQSDSFEHEEARGDFLEAAWEVITFNVAPFFKGRKFASFLQRKTPAGTGPA